MAKSVRVRKDAIVSTTMSYNARVLLDTMADARGMSRSEYLRYLIVQDAKATTPRVVAAAAAEILEGQRGRPAADTSVVADDFLIDETKTEYTQLLREFGMFINQDPIGNAIFTKVLDEPCIIWNKHVYNYDDFCQLSREEREYIVAARLQRLQDRELAEVGESLL